MHHHLHLLIPTVLLTALLPTGSCLSADLRTYELHDLFPVKVLDDQGESTQRHVSGYCQVFFDQGRALEQAVIYTAEAGFLFVSARASQTGTGLKVQGTLPSLGGLWGQPSSHNDVALTITLPAQAAKGQAGEYTALFSDEHTTKGAYKVSEQSTISSKVPNGRHPRLLFGPDEITSLKEKANTPQGQKIIKQLKTRLKRELGGFDWHKYHITKDGGAPYTHGTYAAGHALLYILSGDVAHAQRSRELAMAAIAMNHGEAGRWGISHQCCGVAVAYDLCYDAWPQDFKDDIRRYVLGLSSWIRARSKADKYSPGMFHASVGLGLAAIVGDPVEEPGKPISPAEAPVIEPLAMASGYAGPDWEYADGAFPKSWLVTGLIERGDEEDPFQSIGGFSKLEASKDRRFKWQDTDYTWQHRGWDGNLYKYVVGDPPKHRTDLSKPGYGYFYTQLTLSEDTTVLAEPNTMALGLPSFHTRMWVSGRKVTSPTPLTLKKGTHSLLLEVGILGANAVGSALDIYSEERYQALLAEWERKHESWAQADKTDPAVFEAILFHTQFTRTHLDLVLGDLGFPMEGSNKADMWTAALPFAQAFQNLTGQPLAKGDQLRYAVPLQMIAGNKSRFWAHDWGGRNWITMGFRDLLPDEFVGPIKWYYEANKDYPIVNPWHALFAMVNYPHKADSKNLEEWNLPLHLKDDKAGAYVFKSGWNNEQDFSLIVQLQAHATRHSVTAGDFTIAGRNLNRDNWWLGMDWGGGGWFRAPNLSRHEAPNVLRIEGAIPTRGARLTHYEAKADGSGSLSMINDHWVIGNADIGHSDPKIDDPTDLGISWVRHLAVDYSGRSGSPAVLVVADRVSGHGERPTWLQLNGSQGYIDDIQIEGNELELRRKASKKLSQTGPPMSMHARAWCSTGPAFFSSDSDTRTKRRPGMFWINKPSQAGKIKPGAKFDREPKGDSNTLNELDSLIEAEEEEGIPPPAKSSPPVDYLLVVVFDDIGKPITIDKKGDDPTGTVQVGDLRILFDGKKITFE